MRFSHAINPKGTHYLSLLVEGILLCLEQAGVIFDLSAAERSAMRESIANAKRLERERNMLSIDCETADDEGGPIGADWLSDKGAATERLIDAIDRVGHRDAEWTRRYENARKALRRNRLGYTLKVFSLICKNKADRNASIEAIAASRKVDEFAARTQYFGHRKKILNFFLGQ